MIGRAINFMYDMRDRQRICIALSKGVAGMQARKIDLRHPVTWEFSGFSQNGEDGILDVLRSQMVTTNRYFIEIGASDGIQNNSAWLVFVGYLNGLMIEGDPRLVERIRRMVVNYSIGAECLNMFVSVEKVPELKAMAFHHDPDVFSLDIDGNDYYIAKAIFDAGFRPKIFVVEYNAVFGPEKSVTIKYRSDFVYTDAHPSHLYYGVSISGWRALFRDYGYRFVTVDRNGVNGFFVDPDVFDKGFLSAIQPIEFAENRLQYKKFRRPSGEQFKLIADQPFVAI
jgi:hypothetical protein